MGNRPRGVRSSDPLHLDLSDIMPKLLPQLAQRILALPGIESLEKEPDGWCCHLAYGWTTDALGGGGTIIDSSLTTIFSFVRNAYQVDNS